MTQAEAPRRVCQESFRFPDNHKFLTSEQDVVREFEGHPELIEEFTRRLQGLRLVKRVKRG